jgi:uncharacterized protein YcaQ
MTPSLRQLRARAAAHTFFSVGSLARAFERLPFVQADPIRAPARAQELILRQRVDGYRVGDLDREYPALNLEEGYLYVYGFLPRALWQLRHPPNTARLTALERKVLAKTSELGVVHPDDLRTDLGGRTSVNAWGGRSTMVKLALESLHSRGLLRVARREKGIRLYGLCPPPTEVLAPEQAFARVAQAVVAVLAPAPQRSLRSILVRLARRISGLRNPARELELLVTKGELWREEVDGMAYISPVPGAPMPEAAEPGRVRLLAPFDPLVWDRRRFEHLYGWEYRFEAYTPVAKRVRGYYALPLCLGDRVIGWANVSAVAAGELELELGFAGARPRGREFTRELDAEVERLRGFLQPRAGSPPLSEEYPG